MGTVGANNGPKGSKTNNRRNKNTKRHSANLFEVCRKWDL